MMLHLKHFTEVGTLKSAWWAVAMLLALGLMAGCGWGGSAGQSTQPSQAARASTDKQAIKSIGQRRWYDAASDAYRPPKVAPDLDHPLRTGGTIAGPGQAPAPAAGGVGRGFNWPSGDALAYTILVVLGFGLVGVAIALACVSMRTWRPAADANLAKAITIDPARVADLPFEAQAEMQDPLAYARHLLASGAYDEATIFLYGYMLLALDRAGKIVLHRGKTNRMYWHELGSNRQLRELLLPAMLAFEDVFFGRHSIDRERFFAIWNQLDNFHRMLAPAIDQLAPIEQATAS